MILFDTPGFIEKKMHKLDSMMMKNVRNAAVNADCVLVVVDACKAPQKVGCWFCEQSWRNCIMLCWFSFRFQIDEVLEEGVGDLKNKVPTLLVVNKKDLIKPGEIAKKLEVCNIYHFGTIPENDKFTVTPVIWFRLLHLYAHMKCTEAFYFLSFSD